MQPKGNRLNDQLWANTAIGSCLAMGVDHFFLAPGSRCTPLTLAVARQKQATVIQHFDERGLAFAALGYARATGRPGVFICTSGTAVANAFPAVIEAAMESVPMLLFTADRPLELRGSGANQTIDQQNIFGGYPQLFLDMPAPDDQDTVEDPGGRLFLAEALGRGLAAAKSGPVHFNWMFREPFTIDEQASDETAFVEKKSEAAVAVENKIQLTGNVLIALGSCRVDEAREALGLAERMQCPILSDVTSGLRTGSFELPTQYSLPAPDTILHLGGRILSKTWHQWTAGLPSEQVKLIHVSANDQNLNPHRLPIQRYQNPLQQLSERIEGLPCAADFRDAWQQAGARRTNVICQQLADTQELSEPAVAFFISQYCPVSTGLFLGNSTTIRDADWYGTAATDAPRQVAANRGASGIDGLIATSVGYAAGLKNKTTVVLGDLSALHDLNSLSLVARSPWPIIVVVINNQAGHIFDLLPIQSSPHFEQYFATTHEYQFESAAKMFGLNYRNLSTMADFANSYRAALEQDQSIILEVMTDRQVNLEVRNRIKSEITKCSAS